jgi:hypothetical protein
MEGNKVVKDIIFVTFLSYILYYKIMILLWFKKVKIILST